MRAGATFRQIALAILLASSAHASFSGTDKTQAPQTLRWEEGATGCTFSRDDDGKYRYGFWTADFGIILAVDSQELEKARRRAQPMFALQLAVHYQGEDSVDLAPGKVTL